MIQESMDIAMRESTPYRGYKDNNAKAEITFMQSARAIILTGSLNILLVCTPIAIISYGAGWPDGVTFVFSLLALAPLAERLGFITEQIAIHTNETIGGLLNATFGNATELIVAITALSRGLYKLVQLSLLGSILSNLLLVLGSAFLIGGMRHKTQTFGTISSQINSTLLMLSTMGILFPTILTASGNESNLGQLGLSRGVSLILFCLYFAFLYFQIKTHKDLYEDDDDEDEAGEESKEKEKPLLVNNQNSSSKKNGKAAAVIEKNDSYNVLHDDLEQQQQQQKQQGAAGTVATADKGAVTAAAGGEEKKEGEDDDGDEEDELGFKNALIWLAIATALIAVLSDAISGSIQDAANSAGISGVFIAAIVLPIVGNAAEHAGAVVFAWKGKLDLTLGVAIGSSTQIALCVLPFLVIIAWMMDKDLTLNFGGFEAATLFLSVVSVTFAIKDGKSNWLIGAALISAYFIISIAFLARVNEPLDT